MKIITIEKEVWDRMLTLIEQLADKVDELHRGSQSKRMQRWMDNQDVCWALQISMRKLQSYRENGVIGYSQIGHKIFYRSDEVERLLGSKK